MRQLFGVIESAAIRAGEPTIEAHHLLEEIRWPGAEGAAERDDEVCTGRYRAPEDPGEERAAIAAALERAGGVRTDAARLLGMSRSTLWRKLKEHGLVTDEDAWTG